MVHGVPGYDGGARLPFCAYIWRYRGVDRSTEHKNVSLCPVPCILKSTNGLSVEFEAVIPDEIQVVGKRFLGTIGFGLHLLSHRFKVHGVFDYCAAGQNTYCGTHKSVGQERSGNQLGIHAVSKCKRQFEHMYNDVFLRDVDIQGTHSPR